ncbi:MAG: galactokinase [Synergistaceae bacterium]|nr:galactokinase [Synergistaceae bacterium]
MSALRGGTPIPPFDAMAARFRELYGDDAQPCLFFAPGRVNLIGEHTDHNGGCVLPCAISMGIWAMAAPRPRETVRLWSSRSAGSPPVEAPLRGLEYQAERGWANYPLGVVRALEDRGRALPSGLDVLFHADLPEGVGLSSSAAIEVLTARAANDIFGLGLDGTEIAQAAQEAEVRFVGVRCGIMDQFAVSMGRKHHAILLDCATLAHEQAPLNLTREGIACQIVIADSGVSHSLSASGYNLRRRECEAALEDVRSVRPSVGALCELSEGDLADIGGEGAFGESVLFRRARHAVTENARTLKAAEALRDGDLRELGRLMRASHLSLRDDYEVTTPELDALAELAWDRPGVLGSRMVGGGFGGSTVSIVEDAAIDAFIREVGAGYARRAGREARFYVVGTEDGARRLDAHGH